MNTTFGGFGTQGEDHMPHAVAHEVVTEPQNGDGAQAPAPAAPAVQAHVPKFTAEQQAAAARAIVPGAEHWDIKSGGWLINMAKPGAESGTDNRAQTQTPG